MAFVITANTLMATVEDTDLACLGEVYWRGIERAHKDRDHNWTADLQDAYPFRRREDAEAELRILQAASTVADSDDFELACAAEVVEGIL